MEERLFPILLKIQPEVIELTKESYEERMGIKPSREEVKKVEDVRQPVGAYPAPAYEASVRANTTRQGAIKILQERGFAYKELRPKTRGQLLEML